MNPIAWLNPGRWLAVLIFIGLAWWGYTDWRDHQQDIGYQRAVAEFQAQAQAADAKREQITQYVDREVVKTVREVQVVTETIIKEVPVYVPSDAPDLPGGWRLLHDAAARGEVPDPARIPDAAAVAAAAAAETVAANYGACRENAERLSAFQQWARQQLSAQ